MPLSANSVGIDNHVSRAPRRYQIALIVNGAAGAGTNLIGLRQLSGNAVCRIIRIAVTIAHAAAGLGNPVNVYRATTVAGGSQITASDIPKKDTNDSNATLEVRTGPTGTKANQRLLTIGGTTVGTSGLGGPLDTWLASDIDDCIVLRADEGIIIDQQFSGDADDRYCITIGWEEES